MRTRSAAQIFEDLRDLCHKPGFLHALSFILFRDFYASIDDRGKITTHGEHDRYARSRLINNEFMLLGGLLVQSATPAVFRDAGDPQLLVSQADALLEELHTHMEAPLRQMLQPPLTGTSSDDHFGALAKEAIYYGAESAFVFQYQRFARDRYRFDFEWLLRNKGLSSRPIIDIAQYVVDLTELQLNLLLAKDPHQTHGLSPIRLTSAFSLNKQLITETFGSKGVAFLELFSIPIHNSNLAFDHPTAYNELNSRPIIDRGDDVYLTSSYKLFESLYESPYYWMMADSKYRDVASFNRGTFLERTITTIASKIFGEDHVFANATIRSGSRRIAAEADVLIVYGEFTIVIQAKSKRLTIDARSGDLSKIKEDFRSSVQAAYDQAVRFIELLLDGAECEVRSGELRSFKEIVRVFPVVVLSDHFPSLTYLTNHLIVRHVKYDPVVVDIFLFDVLARLLPHPVDALYYLQQRSRFFDRIIADSEFDLLGHHMAQKLYVPDDCDFMSIDKSFGGDINDYFAAKEVGASSRIEFRRLEERVDVPIVAAQNRLRQMNSSLKAHALRSAAAWTGIARHLLP